MEHVYKVPKIRCEGCAETITKTLAGLTGIRKTRVAIAEREVHIEFDPGQVDEARVRRALADAGFPPA